MGIKMNVYVCKERCWVVYGNTKLIELGKCVLSLSKGFESDLNWLTDIQNQHVGGSIYLYFWS